MNNGSGLKMLAVQINSVVGQDRVQLLKSPFIDEKISGKRKIEGFG